MKLTRRSIFPIAAAAAAGATNGIAHGSIVEYMEKVRWVPGMQFPVEWMPLDKYLAMIEEAMRGPQS